MSATAKANPDVFASFLWTATSGTFSSPDWNLTNYRCGSETAPTITLTAYYGDCADRVEIPLDCT